MFEQWILLYNQRVLCKKFFFMANKHTHSGLKELLCIVRFETIDLKCLLVTSLANPGFKPEQSKDALQ